MTAAELRVLQRAVLALHPKCDPHCVLDNGRVWGMCRAGLLIGREFSEAQVREAILALPVNPKRAAHVARASKIMAGAK